MSSNNICFAVGCDNYADTEYCPECLRNGGVKIPVKMYSRIIEEELTYGDAMNRCIVDGDKVARASWGGYWVKEWDEIFGDIIIAVLKDRKGKAPATPYQEDMLADDWMVVE